MTKSSFFLATTLMTSTVSAGEISLQIQGLELLPKEGAIIARIFDNESAFPSDKWLQQISMNMTGGQGLSFKNMGAGDYAIVVFHDENNNGKLDANFIGIPKEPVVVSNNAKGSMGPPKFQDAKVSLGEDETKTILINFGKK